MDTSPPYRMADPRRPRMLRARASAGFTIVEVVMATFVMLFGISSSIIVMQSGFKALDTARKTTLASQIMQSEMERIRMLSWTKISALIDAEPKIDLAEIFPKNTQVEREMLEQMNLTFTAIRTVTMLSDYDDEVAQISVSITWRGLDGTSHNRSSNTRYCKDGLYAYYYRAP